MTRCVVGLLSGIKLQDRRDLCNSTWVPELESRGVDVVYLMGGGGSVVRSGRRLILPCQDAYPFLPQKTRGFCRWAMDFEFDYLFKADDDTLVHPDRFIEFLDDLSSDYVGCEPGGKWLGYASGGAGYFLSRKSAEVIASKMNKPRGAEDKLVGRFLKNEGIKFVQDKRFVPWGNPNRVPKPGNDLITTHKIAPALWRKCWRDLNGVD